MIHSTRQLLTSAHVQHLQTAIQSGALSCEATVKPLPSQALEVSPASPTSQAEPLGLLY